MNNEEVGTLVWAGGVLYVGIVCIQGHMWVAYKLEDTTKALYLIIEDKTVPSKNNVS